MGGSQNGGGEAGFCGAVPLLRALLWAYGLFPGRCFCLGLGVMSVDAAAMVMAAAKDTAVVMAAVTTATAACPRR